MDEVVIAQKTKCITGWEKLKMKANQINHVKIQKDQQVPKDNLILQSQSHLPFGRTS